MWATMSQQRSPCKIIQDGFSVARYAERRNERRWNSINVKADSFFVTGSLRRGVCYAALYASSRVFFSRIESAYSEMYIYMLRSSSISASQLIMRAIVDAPTKE